MDILDTLVPDNVTDYHMLKNKLVDYP